MSANISVTGEARIDWSHCPFVEVNPHVQEGTPVVRGTQVSVNAIITKFNRGVTVAQLSTRFKIPQDSIRAILFYVKGQGGIRPE